MPVPSGKTSKPGTITQSPALIGVTLENRLKPWAMVTPQPLALRTNWPKWVVAPQFGATPPERPKIFHHAVVGAPAGKAAGVFRVRVLAVLETMLLEEAVVVPRCQMPKPAHWLTVQPGLPG